MKYACSILLCLFMLAAYSLFDAHAYSVMEDKLDTTRTQNSPAGGETKFEVPFFNELFDPVNSAPTPYRLQVASHGMQVEFAEKALLSVLSRANEWPRQSKTHGSSLNLSDFFSNSQLGETPDAVTIAYDPSMRLRQFSEQYPKNGLLSPSSSNTPAPVPEPATLMLLGFALSGMALWARKRK